MPSGAPANSSGAKVTSTRRVPLPMGMSASRGRSSTGIVMRRGRGRAPCSRFQWAIVSAVVTMSWSFTVYGEPLGRWGRASSVTRRPLPGMVPGVPGATRAGGDQLDGASTGSWGASGGRTGGAVGALSLPP